jgi:hypothetical protein
MVYGFLLDSEDRDALVRVRPYCEDFLYPSECTLARRYPHIVNAEYVGSETRLELVEMWYRSSIFILKPNDDVSELLS